MIRVTITWVNYTLKYYDHGYYYLCELHTSNTMTDVNITRVNDTPGTL
jgi:hypothetical protein